jgi:hypothetical protein
MVKATGLRGNFGLTHGDINANVTYRSPGVYAVGAATQDGLLAIRYVGRADEDINRCLHDHVGKYEAFQFEYFQTALAAYYKECDLYHDFGPPDNAVHPAKPILAASCPRCGT